MIRLYENRNIWRRNTLLIGVVVIVMIWGVWELWHAAHSGDATTGAMFGVLFLAGGAYSLYQLINDQRDLVATLDRDEATGTLTASVWQPQGPLQVAGPLTGWRPHVKLSRREQLLYLYADAPGYPRPLRFDLKAGTDLTGLRGLAPDAVAEFEALAAGKSPA